MRKKFLSICIMIACCVGMVGCSSHTAKKDTSNPYPVLGKALDQTNQADNMQGNMEIDMVLHVAEQELAMESKLNFTMQNAQSSETLQCEMIGSMSMLGVEESIAYYIKDGQMYMDAMGKKVKVMDISQADKVTNQIGLAMIKEDQVKVIKEKKKDGTTVLSVELKDEEAQDLVSKLLGNDFESMLGSSEGDNLKIHDVAITFVIDKEGYIINQDTKFVMETKIENETISVDVNSHTTYSSFEKQEIVFPDFSEYVEAPSI